RDSCSQDCGVRGNARARRDRTSADGEGRRLVPAPVLARRRPDDPKPFVCHKTTDEILDSLAACCQRINDSGHWGLGAQRPPTLCSPPAYGSATALNV